jgi:ABC-2 type transport system permease protein
MTIPLVVCGILAFMSIGLLVGAIAKTQQAATSIANLIILPMAFLGGAFIPLDLAPDWVRQASYAAGMTSKSLEAAVHSGDI